MKNKVVVIIALVLSVMCLFIACGKKDGPGTVNTTPATNDEPVYRDPNIKYTAKPGEEDSAVVVLYGPSEASDETVTYYFVGDVYSRQESVIVYATEEAAQVGFTPVSTYEDAKLEGNTVSFKFVSNAFQGMNKQQVVEYWEKQFKGSPEFYKTWSVKIETKANTSANGTDTEIDALAVELLGKGDAATETVTYYFINDVYTSQKSVIEYATEDAAKVGFTPVSSYEEAKLDGKTVSFKFVSSAFAGMNRDQVVEYWEKQFESSDGFYANYSVSIIDTSSK